MIDNIFQWPISKQRDGRRSEIPYSDDALRANLLRLKIAWEEFQSTRDRAAVYLYLTAVFELVAVWEKEGNAERLASRGLRLRLGDWKLAADPIAAVIFLTSDPKKVDRRTRSKWSRVLQYADEFKGQAEPLQDFIQRKGGINKCAARYAKYLGRDGKKAANRKPARTLADSIREERLSKGGLARGR